MLGLAGKSYAQDTLKTKKTERIPMDSVKKIITGAPMTVDLKTDEDKKDKDEDDKTEPKKKKHKKNVFYGEKTKKGYTRSGYGSGVTIELFHYLKEYKGPDEYVPDFYWYDSRAKRIKDSKNVNKKFAGVLHGPYQKIRNGEVVVEGMYWHGLKHGRWMYYDNNGILLNKEIYFKGWHKESEITYYGQDRQKIKEVVPVQYGEKEGEYYYFYPDGQMAVKGQYHFDHKVGTWIEYYPYRRRRKKYVQYRHDAFNGKFDPYIEKEWDIHGKLLYDHKPAQ